jgi:hypothetical protein
MTRRHHMCTCVHVHTHRAPEQDATQPCKQSRVLLCCIEVTAIINNCCRAVSLGPTAVVRSALVRLLSCGQPWSDCCRAVSLGPTAVACCTVAITVVPKIEWLVMSQPQHCTHTSNVRTHHQFQLGIGNCTENRILSADESCWP